MKKNAYYFITTFIYQLILWAIYVPLLFALKRNDQSVLYTFLIPIIGFLFFIIFAINFKKMRNYIYGDLKTFFLLPICFAFVLNIVFTLLHYTIWSDLYTMENIVMLLTWPLINCVLFIVPITISNLSINQDDFRTKDIHIINGFIYHTILWVLFFVLIIALKKSFPNFDFFSYMAMLPFICSICYYIFLIKAFDILDSIRDFGIQIAICILYNLTFGILLGVLCGGIVWGFFLVSASCGCFIFNSLLTALILHLSMNKSKFIAVVVSILGFLAMMTYILLLFFDINIY